MHCTIHPPPNLLADKLTPTHANILSQTPQAAIEEDVMRASADCARMAEAAGLALVRRALAPRPASPAVPDSMGSPRREHTLLSVRSPSAAAAAGGEAQLSAAELALSQLVAHMTAAFAKAGIAALPGAAAGPAADGPAVGSRGDAPRVQMAHSQVAHAEALLAAWEAAHAELRSQVIPGYHIYIGIRKCHGAPP